MGVLVLVVDDDPDIQELLSMFFRSEGFDVAIASDGAEGAHAALQLRPAVVVMDGRMPVLDGWSATAHIKASAPEQCVIMLSSLSGAEHVRRAQQVGCDRFLRKPPDLRVLLQAVRDCIAGRAKGAAR